MAPDSAPLITYAQNLEDVRLWKALSVTTARTYVDVGAGNPTRLSVTRLFHEHGWRGVNIEPGPEFSALALERQSDVNVRVVVGLSEGTVQLYVAHPYPDLSSPDERIVAANPLVTRTTPTDVECRRLASILDEHLGDRELGFLKVDTEGSEAEVLASNDWDRFRPLVVVVEAIDPISRAPTHDRWEPRLLDAGFELAVFDGINRFYARADRPDLRVRLAEPVSVLDDYVPYDLLGARVALAQAERERSELLAEVAAERAEHSREQKGWKRDLHELLGTTARVDRRCKETETELAAVLARIHDERVVAATRLAAEHQLKLEQLADLKASWAWRIGQGAVRLSRPVQPAVRARRRRRELARSRPMALAAAVEAATAPGTPLETVRTLPVDPPYRDVDAAPRALRSLDPAEGLWRQLASARSDRPRLLDADEHALLRDAMPRLEPGIRDVVGQVLELDVAGSGLGVDPLPVDRRSTVVVDVRALQFPVSCGTRIHALEVLDAALRRIEGRARVLFLGTPALPPLDADLEALADGRWRPSALPSVSGYLQLAPFIQTMERTDLALLQAPWVRRTCVWLDGIIGSYPHSFLRDANSFLMYQLGLQKLARADEILALSPSCAIDARRLVGPGPELAVTGCRSRFDAPPRGDAHAQEDRAPYVVAVGNALPHKNVAVAVAGAVAAAQRGARGLRVVVLANLLAEQRAALEDLVRDLGAPSDLVTFAALVPDDEFEALVAGAEAMIVPSFDEGFSLPVIESIQLGTPVVVSDIPAHRDLLDDDRWRFVADDPNALVNVLRRVLSNPAAALAAQRDDVRQHLDGFRFEDAVGQAVEQLLPTTVLATAPPDPEPLGPVAEAGPLEHDLALSKVCELEDFTQPRLMPVIRDVFAHELARFGPEFPRGREWRKYWEVAMAVLTFRETGLLDGTANFLGIGAGNEPTIFHLTHHARSVLASDLYLADSWGESAHSSMLDAPERHWPFLWRRDRLTVMHMDALALDLADESVDGIFSSSSVEHFGTYDDLRSSLDEMYRVLRPGGVVSISSEFRLEGAAPGAPGVMMFDTDDVMEHFVGTRAWKLVEPFDEGVSLATRATELDFAEVCGDQAAQVARLGGLWTHHVEYERYPHLVLSMPTHTFTSFHIALQKFGARAG